MPSIVKRAPPAPARAVADLSDVSSESSQPPPRKRRIVLPGTTKGEEEDDDEFSPRGMPPPSLRSAFVSPTKSLSTNAPSSISASSTSSLAAAVGNHRSTTIAAPAAAAKSARAAAAPPQDDGIVADLRSEIHQLRASLREAEERVSLYQRLLHEERDKCNDERDRRLELELRLRLRDEKEENDAEAAASASAVRLPRTTTESDSSSQRSDKVGIVVATENGGGGARRTLGLPRASDPVRARAAASMAGVRRPGASAALKIKPSLRTGLPDTAEADKDGERMSSFGARATGRMSNAAEITSAYNEPNRSQGKDSAVLQKAASSVRPTPRGMCPAAAGRKKESGRASGSLAPKCGVAKAACVDLTAEDDAEGGDARCGVDIGSFEPATSDPTNEAAAAAISRGSCKKGETSAETVARLTEMGFDREDALDAVFRSARGNGGSTDPEAAVEYCLGKAYESSARREDQAVDVCARKMPPVEADVIVSRPGASKAGSSHAYRFGGAGAGADDDALDADTDTERVFLKSDGDRDGPVARKKDKKAACKGLGGIMSGLKSCSSAVNAAGNEATSPLERKAPAVDNAVVKETESKGKVADESVLPSNASSDADRLDANGPFKGGKGQVGHEAASSDGVARSETTPSAVGRDEEESPDASDSHQEKRLAETQRRWDERMELLRRFYEENGHLDIRLRRSSLSATDLAAVSVRSEYTKRLKKGMTSKFLTTERMKDLKRMGFVFPNGTQVSIDGTPDKKNVAEHAPGGAAAEPSKTQLIRDNQWSEKYEALKAFKEKNGHIEPPYASDLKLYLWVRYQRERFHKWMAGAHMANPMTPKQRDLLVEIGFDFGGEPVKKDWAKSLRPVWDP